MRKRVFVSTDKGGVTLGSTWLADDPTGLAFREIVLLTDPRNRLSAPFGAYKFPEEMSFSTCFSSESSATRRLSRMFSFSSSFIRFA